MTDDGDFAILGVNAEETSSSEDADMNMTGQNTGFDLSALMSATSFAGLSGDNSLGGTPPAQSTPTVASIGSPQTSGVTGRMDIGGEISLNDALFGRLSSHNVGAVTTSDATAASKTLQSSFASAASGVTGSMGIGGENSLNDALFGRLPSHSMGAATASDATTTTKTLQSSSQGEQKSTEERSVSTAKTSPVDTQQSDYDESSLIEIEEWLLTVIPKLSDNDIESYTRGLSRIGFHPECATMCELKYEDLEFMKVLHRRYLFNEVTGIEHPFEV